MPVISILAHAGILVAPAISKESGLSKAKGEDSMLWTIIVILLVLWLLGLLTHVGGGLVHLLLVIAAVVLVINLLTGRRAV
jgi:uncharacterized protein DUF5670